MNTEVTEFRASDFADKVKNKIKAAFVDLIPEEKWDELVKGELELLMTKRQKDKWGDYMAGDRQRVSIYDMITSALKEVIKEKINSEIKPLFESHWDTEKQKNVLSDLVKKMVINNADKIFFSIIESAIGNAISTFQSNLINNY